MVVIFEKHIDKNETKILYGDRQREDFFNFSITIYIVNNKIEKIYLNDSCFGVMICEENRVSIKSWEREDDMEKISFLTKHFPQIISDGEIHDFEYEKAFLSETRNKISADKCLNFEDKLLLNSAMLKLGNILSIDLG